MIFSIREIQSSASPEIKIMLTIPLAAFLLWSSYKRFKP